MKFPKGNKIKKNHKLAAEEEEVEWLRRQTCEDPKAPLQCAPVSRVTRQFFSVVEGQ